MLAAVVALLSAGPAAHATVAGTKLVPGYLNGLPLATSLGAAPAGQTISIGVEIARPNPSGEQSLYKAMITPGDPQYHHFLTPAQFNSQFGVSPAQTDAVRSWLASGGLTLGSGSSDYVLARGTVAQLDSLLALHINDYSFKGLHFVANDAPPSVPTSLPIAGIAGLDTINKFRLQGCTATSSPGSRRRRATGSALRRARSPRPAPSARRPAARTSSPPRSCGASTTIPAPPR